jgi:hypothetical protein
MYKNVVRDVLKPADQRSESCPNCGGQWFTQVYRLRHSEVGLFGRYALDETCDEYEFEHQAEEGFACALCGAVITQDQHGGLAVDAPREGALLKRAKRNEVE